MLLVPIHIGFATMRYLVPIAAVSSIWLSGCCAGMLHCSGLDLDKLQSDAEVQNRLGSPKSSGTTEGKRFEDYHTHQKIAQRDGIYYAMGFVMTLGLGDLIFFPIEVVKASNEMSKGHDVRVIYEADGKVSAILVDGKHHVGFGELVSPEVAKLRQRLRQSQEGAPSLPGGPHVELSVPPLPASPLIELPVPPIDPKGVDPQHP